MTSIADTIELPEHPEYRARIVHDEYGDAPEFEEGVPTYEVTMSRYYGWSSYGSALRHVYGRESDIIEHAWNHFASETRNHDGDVEEVGEILDRYLRIFRDGAARVFHDGDSWYLVAITNAELSDWQSITAGEAIAEAESGEYFSWLNGDSYGIVIERKVIERTEIKSLSGVTIRATEAEAWEEVESCWGFYGDPCDSTGYIQTEAHNMLMIEAVA